MICPTVILDDYVSNLLDLEARLRLAAHVAACPACMMAVAQLRGNCTKEDNNTGETKVVQPEIGMGVTYRIGSDRYACTIHKMTRSRKTIYVTRDATRVVSGSEYTGDAKYEYTPQPDLPYTTVTLRRSGQWVEKYQDRRGGVYLVGERESYRDPSF